MVNHTKGGQTVEISPLNAPDNERRYLRTSLRVTQTFLPGISRWGRILEKARLSKTQIPTPSHDSVVLNWYVQKPSSRQDGRIGAHSPSVRRGGTPTFWGIWVVPLKTFDQLVPS